MSKQDGSSYAGKWISEMTCNELITALKSEEVRHHQERDELVREINFLLSPSEPPITFWEFLFGRKKD
jgi:hypothetical protein